MSTAPQLTPSQINYAETSQWKAILRQALADLRVAIPAIVQEFDAATQTVTVQIALREVVRMPAGAQNIAIQPVYKVPVCLPRAGGFALTLPIEAGDEGMLVFCDMCIDLWWARGGVQNQLERRRHDLSDCGFFPGIWNQKRLLSNYSANSAQLRSDDGSVVVDLATTGITLTGPKVTVNSLGDVDIAASGNVNIQGKTWLSHQHTGVQTGGGDTGPVL